MKIVGITGVNTMLHRIREYAYEIKNLAIAIGGFGAVGPVDAASYLKL